MQDAAVRMLRLIVAFCSGRQKRAAPYRIGSSKRRGAKPSANNSLGILFSIPGFNISSTLKRSSIIRSRRAISDVVTSVYLVST